MAWRWSVCGTAEVVWKPRFLWPWPSAHLHFLVSCFSFSSWQYPIDSLGFRSGEFAGQSSTPTPWSFNQLLVLFGSVGRSQILLENEISFFKKLVSRRKHEVLKNVLVDGCVDWTSENVYVYAFSRHFYPKRLTVHSDYAFFQYVCSLGIEPTTFCAANAMHYHWATGTQWTNTSRWHGSPNHHWLWKLHTGLQATWILFLSSRPPDSGTLIFKLNAKLTFIWKEDFGPLSNSPVIFLFSPGKMLLTMFLFQKCLGGSFPEDVWAWWLLMHWLQLQFTPCEALPSVWIGFAWQYSHACGHLCCLCTFSYPISSFQSTLHLICFDTAHIEQPPLSVMTLCDLLSLWRCQWSSSGPLPSQQCSPLLCFQRTRDTHNVYCMDGHLLKLKCKYSNTLKYWFLTFML